MFLSLLICTPICLQLRFSCQWLVLPLIFHECTILSFLLLLSTHFQLNSYFEHMVSWLLDISRIWFLIAWNLTYKVSGLKPSCRNFPFNFMEVLYVHMIFVEAHLHFNHPALVLWTSILIWSQNIVEALVDSKHPIVVLWTTSSMISLISMKFWLQVTRTMNDTFWPLISTISSFFW